jgi:hypothetical protein
MEGQNSKVANLKGQSMHRSMPFKCPYKGFKKTHTGREMHYKTYSHAKITLMKNANKGEVKATSTNRKWTNIQEF